MLAGQQLVGRTASCFIAPIQVQRVLSGAAAFIEVWARLRRWRCAGRAATLPGVITALELSYRGFLPVRPFIALLFRNMQKLGVRAGQENRG
jgi:hypothetical protein